MNKCITQNMGVAGLEGLETGCRSYYLCMLISISVSSKHAQESEGKAGTGF